LLVVILFAVSLRFIIDQFIASPKVNYFKNKNSDLRIAYNILEDRIRKSELFLEEVQRRDDRMYRSVLDLEPLPGSFREAGFGGAGTLYRGMLKPDGIALINNTDTRLEKLSNKVEVQSWSLGDLYIKAKDHQKLLLAKPSMHPISPADSFWMTSTFGYRRDPFSGRRNMHFGIDLAGPVGLKIHATGDGIIVAAENSRNGYGKEVLVDHGFGFMTRYAHLQKITVRNGQKIRRGELLGHLGTSGRSTGPHLHYEVIYRGKNLNPVYFYFENLTGEEYNRIVSLASR
jgi:murein DD-endopeptidase MepM/ murein hydrolase activator NlpD